MLFASPALIPTVKSALEIVASKRSAVGPIKVYLLARSETLKDNNGSGYDGYESIMASGSEVKKEGFKGVKFEKGDENSTALLCYSSGAVSWPDEVPGVH